VSRRGSASVKQLTLPLGNPGDETASGARGEEAPVQEAQLLERVLEPDNLRRALRQVQRNKGAPGIDRMTVDAVGPYLKEHWPKTSLLDETYAPQPVRRVAIPKSGGGERMLGVPVAVDRFIEQALMQVLQEQWDPTFSENSFGFRPKRSAHQAIAQAQAYLREGYTFVVDLDLEKFLDPSSQCPPFHERVSNRPGCVLTALIRKPFLLPWRT
jgi:RNA-directed DNA polymerase